MSKVNKEFFMKKCMGLLHDPIGKTLYHFFEKSNNKLSILEELKTDYGKLYEWTLNGFLKDEKIKVISKIDINTWKDIKKSIDQNISSKYRFFEHTFGNEKYYGDFKENGKEVIGFYNIFSDTIATESLETAVEFINKEKEFYEKQIFSRIPYCSENEQDWREFYLYLWTILDLFYLANTKIPIPEDTRSPITDIIDHLYAWATMFNLESGGHYVLVDFAGIQSFLEKSRKVSDLWSSSWLISMFAWKVIEPFLLYYGPDILIKPTARTNPIWLLTVFNYFKDIGKNEYIGTIWEYFKNWIGENDAKKLIHYNNGYISAGKILTRTALIPASLTLIIPELDKEDIINIIEIFKAINFLSNERFEDFEDFKKTLDTLKDFEEILSKVFDYMIKKLWKEFVNSVYKIFDIGYIKFIPSEDSYFYLFDEEKINNIIKDQVSNKPPFVVRVLTEKINSYNDLLNNLGSSLEIENKDEKFEDSIYLRVNKKLIEESQAVTSYNPYFFEPTIKNKPLSEYVYENNNVKTPGFRFCSVCGLNPAIIDSKMIQPTSEKDDDDKDRIRLFFKENERFCPYCFLKRLFVYNLSRQISHFSFKLFFKNIYFETDYHYIPKTVVSYALAEVVECISKLDDNSTKYLLKIIQEKGENIKQIDKKKVENYLKKRLLKKDINGLFNDENKLKIVYWMYKQFDDKKKLEKLKIDKEDYKLQAIEEYYNNPIFVYGYADNDYMGAIFEKRYDGAFRVKKENIKDPDNQKIKLEDSLIYNNVMNLIENGYGIDGKKVELVYIKGKHKMEYEEVKNVIKNKKEFWYNFSIEEWMEISRIIMINTIKELLTIDNEKDLNAHVIYAGGDDLVFICSRDSLIKLVEITRKIYSQGFYEKNSGRLGFYLFNNKSNIPTLGLAGRSYSIVLTHPKTPLFTVISTARSQEKSIKKGKAFAFLINNNEIKIKRKDLMILTYLSRCGSLKYSVLPFRLLDSNEKKDAIKYSFDIPEKIIKIYQKYFKHKFNKEKIAIITKTGSNKMLSNEIYRDIIVYLSLSSTSSSNDKSKILTEFLEEKFSKSNNIKRIFPFATLDKYIKEPEEILPINVFLVNYNDKKKVTKKEIKNGSPIVLEMFKTFIILSNSKIYSIKCGDKDDN